ncbi:Rz-like lysis system protein LysB [Pectobacterium zantedeschiae]|uniref:LysB family phage lysis regulatory protein n=1 Tax=Pectobacterium zantedeschiae TaxID=2034769 RepID=A0A9X8P3B2_9GAMM|nr:Rz-like lysis system protein LysB [Pectobacterium zantedeschiae]RYC38891.1 LysB family phage lysis regulatory protein [Pectobacterium zantedeschiae]
MSKPLTQFSAIVAACLLAVLVITKWQLSRAENSLSQQAITLSQQKDTLLAQSAAIGSLQNNTRRNEQAQAALRTKLSQAGQLAAGRERTLTRLLNENADLRRWYSANLPDDVKRLHRRPDFDNPDAYLRWLSESNELPDTGQQPTDQR